ncbi:MAG: hypothetical protein IIA88_02295 [Bacteroidetes bacterium]|nr:hypothetical protein [Bacteroidota bacterium]
MRVNIPKNPDKLLHLAEDIVQKHNKDGANSVLTAVVDMPKFVTRTADGRTDHKTAIQLRKDSETISEKLQKALGVHKDQKTTNPGHIIYQVKQIRDVLSGKFRGNLKKLGDWGFQVDD